MTKEVIVFLLALLTALALGGDRTPLDRSAEEVAVTTSDPIGPNGVCIDPDGNRVPCPIQGGP